MICLRMFPYMGWASGCFDFPFLADARNVQVPVEHCCIRVCPDILEGCDNTDEMSYGAVTFWM